MRSPALAHAIGRLHHRSPSPAFLYIYYSLPKGLQLYEKKCRRVWKAKECAEWVVSEAFDEIKLLEYV